MSHVVNGVNHYVIDTDSHFEIDATTRAITNAAHKKSILTQYDHNSERFSFEVDRMIEGHDMSLCNRVEIHFTNKNASTSETNPGTYEVKDYAVHAANNDKMLFTWLVSDEATIFAGPLMFSITFLCEADDGAITYRWGTGINSSISISTGMNNGEYIAERFPDILSQWKADLWKRNYSYEGAVQNGFEGTEEEWYAHLEEYVKGTILWEAKQNSIDWITEKEIDAMFEGTYTGVEDEAGGKPYVVAQTDWNQNDPEQIDYLKNRPFGEQMILVCEGTVDGDPNWDGSDIWEVYFNDGTEFKNGDVLNITLTENGQVYSTDIPIIVGEDCIYWDEEKYGYLEGCNWYFTPIYSDGVFLIAITVRDMSLFDPNTTVKVYKTTYIQIDEKFIPDTIARKTETDYEVECTPSPSEWFTFGLNADGSTYSAKANFSNEDAHIVDIVIPATHAGLPVTTIKAGGFSEKENIKSIIIPDTVNVIEEKAFQGCTNLQKVVLPKGIEILTDSMFENCTSLVQIDLPKGIKEIQYDVFRKTSIEFIDLPYGIKYIGETLFAENANLKRVNIPDTVTRIDARAFYKCTSLEEIVIPNSVVEMSYNTFTSCKGLKRAVIGTGLKSLTASDFMYCDALEIVILPKTITNMTKDIFWNTSYKPNPNVTLYVEQGSYAEEYAKQYKMQYVYCAISEMPGANDMSEYIKKTEFDGLFEVALSFSKTDIIAIAPQDNYQSEMGVAPSLAVMDYYIDKAISEFAQKNGLMS